MADIPTSYGGTNYTLSVPLSGVSKAARVCGWIDFDVNGHLRGRRACLCQPGSERGIRVIDLGGAGDHRGQHQLRPVPGGVHHGPGGVPDWPGRLRRGRGLRRQLRPATAQRHEDRRHPVRTGREWQLHGDLHGQGDQPGQPSTRYGALTDTPAFDPNLTVTGASWTGQSTGSASGTGPFTLAAANTNIAANAIHTYNVTVTFRYTGAGTAAACAGSGTGLYNSASLPAGQETGATSDNSACLAPPARPAPAITIDKQAGTPSGNTAGSTIAYSFVVTNTGTRGADAVSASPTPRSASVSCSGDLPGHRCLHDLHRDLHADPGRRERRVVNNTATAAGTPPRGHRDRHGLHVHDDHADRVDHAGQAGGHAVGEHGRVDDRLLVHRDQHRQRDA